MATERKNTRLPKQKKKNSFNADEGRCAAQKKNFLEEKKRNTRPRRGV